MRTDLFNIYKLYLQRMNRRPKCTTSREIKLLMGSILKDKLTNSDKLRIAKQIVKLERTAPGVRKVYGTEVVNALQTGKFVVNVPYQVQHKWKENDDSEGWIYIATASKKPEQVRIGATTTASWKLEELYYHKYGYYMSIVWKEWVNKPFHVKEAIKTRVKDKRVSGLTNGDSNEWYHLEVSNLIVITEEYI